MRFDFNKEEYNIQFWDGEKLDRDVVLDTETTIAPFHTTPDLVTVQAYDGNRTVYYIPLNKFRLFLNRHNRNLLIFHNAPFDVDVIHKFLDTRMLYDWYDADLIRDTNILYKLYHLAVMGFSPFKSNLNFLTQKFIGEELDKEGDERMSFAQFHGKELKDISESHLLYGAKDVVATYQVYRHLMNKIGPLDKMGTLLSHDIQVKGDLALNHIYKHGIGFNLSHRDEWMREKQVQLDELETRLSDWGWVRGAKGINEQYHRIITKYLKIDQIPYRYKGNICRQLKDGRWIFANGKEQGKIVDGEPSLSSTRKDLTPFTHIPFIKDYLNYIELEKATTFVRDLTSSVLHPRYSTLLNTGRTSCTKPNVQQLPRVGGVREMFVPTREGEVFIDVDYSSLELATLAQVCYTRFGHSLMRNLINEGKCLHYHTASSVYGKPESKITKEERQFAKIPNFGFGANMSPSTFVEYCDGMGVKIDEAKSEEVKAAWLDTYPEMSKFFNVGNNKNCYTLTGRRRANCTYTAYLNTQFQGLAADGAKLALYELDKRGYNMVAFIHDQIVVQAPKEAAKDMMTEVEKIMQDAMQIVCPDVKIGTEGQIIEKFTK